MHTLLPLLLLLTVLAPCPLRAFFSAADDPAIVAQQMESSKRHYLSKSVEQAAQKEAARERQRKIDQLPLREMRLFLSSDQSDETLNRLTEEAKTAPQPTPLEKVTEEHGFLVRLGAILATLIVCFLAWRWQRGQKPKA
ncbi:MAG: hypothetical protein RSD41_02070 [Kiritimatiellia bacterium]